MTPQRSRDSSGHVNGKSFVTIQNATILATSGWVGSLCRKDLRAMLYTSQTDHKLNGISGPVLISGVDVPMESSHYGYTPSSKYHQTNL